MKHFQPQRIPQIDGVQYSAGPLNNIIIQFYRLKALEVSLGRNPLGYLSIGLTADLRLQSKHDKWSFVALIFLMTVPVFCKFSECSQQ